MKLLDHYLQAVRSHLPAGPQQDDILREISDDILSQMDEKEAELGRPLNPTEQEVVLYQHGHPMLVASRFLPRQHLIGPSVFPFYRSTLEITLWIAIILYVVAACLTPFVFAIAPDAGKLPDVFKTGPLVLGAVALEFVVFGMVTLIFVALEALQARFNFLNAAWSPRKPPVSSLPPPKGAHSPRASKWILTATAVSTLWWLATPYYPYLMFGPAAALLQRGPGLRWAYVPVLLLNLVAMWGLVIGLARTDWTRFRLYAHQATAVVGLVFLYFSRYAGDFVVAKDPISSPLWLSVTNQAIFMALSMAMWFAALDCLRLCAPYIRNWINKPSDLILHRSI